MTDLVIAALVKRRAELSGQIETTQGQLQQLHADLASLDAVIRQFDPDYNVGAIRPKYRPAPTAAEFGSISPHFSPASTGGPVLGRGGGAGCFGMAP